MVSMVSLEEQPSPVELSDFAKATISAGYLILICLTGCVVKDLTLVFGFLSGVAECLITFILPSVFWFISLKIEKS